MKRIDKTRLMTHAVELKLLVKSYTTKTLMENVQVWLQPSEIFNT